MPRKKQGGRSSANGRSRAIKTRKSIRLGHAHANAYVASLQGQPATAAPAFAGWLIAQGDSWYNYRFGRDIVKNLKRDYGYEIDNLAQQGNSVFDMAHDPGYMKILLDTIRQDIDLQKIPSAILLSGGGNDIADNFEGFLNRAGSANPGWGPGLDNFINGTLRDSYVILISAITKLCKELVGQPIPILVHGYADPVPDGRGILWRVWLKPGFERQGYTNLDDRKRLAGEAIDKFNTMLAGLPADPQANFGHVIYADLRPALSSGANYKSDWENELHPTEPGWDKVTKIVAAALPKPAIAGASLGVQPLLAATRARGIVRRPRLRP